MQYLSSVSPHARLSLDACLSAYCFQRTYAKHTFTNHKYSFYLMLHQAGYEAVQAPAAAREAVQQHQPAVHEAVQAPPAAAYEKQYNLHQKQQRHLPIP
jgi:hypothetical protein